MTAYPNSAARQAAAIRAHARRGVWRRLLSAVGVTAHTRAADAEAARWGLGGQWEQVTARMLAPLEAEGWRILHDRRLPSGANLDHVLITPDGTEIVVLDTKRWDISRPTVLRRGRVCCGTEDRHDQVVKVAGYADTVARRLRVPEESVTPLLVVHGSPVAGGHLDVMLLGRSSPVYVLDPEWLMSTLTASGRKAPADPQRAGALARRVDQVLPRYPK